MVGKNSLHSSDEGVDNSCGRRGGDVGREVDPTKKKKNKKTPVIVILK